jgi:predicted amidohydrolase
MRLTLCEFPDESANKARAWDELVDHCVTRRSDIVVLPEMPFSDWRIFMADHVDDDAWRQTCTAHDEAMAKFSELGVQTVLSSRPVTRDGGRFNQAFSWTPEDGYAGGHCKCYLPDEPDGREST